MIKKFSKKIKSVIYLPNENAEAKLLTHSIDIFKNLPLPSIHYIDQEGLEHTNTIPSKFLRMCNKNALLAIEALNDLNLKTEIQAMDKSRIGLYVAGPWSLLNIEVSNAVKREGLSPYSAMKNYSNPKFNLKNLLSHLPGHLSIHFGITGPANSFHDLNCAKHAIECATWDLKSNFVDMAIIVVLNTYDELITAAEQAYFFSENVFFECACTIILKQADLSNTDLVFKEPSSKRLGYLHPIQHLWDLK